MIRNRRGFTLAELLIVVAIIAVLVAIAIPVFNKKIEKSRETYDIATMRQAASAAVDLYYSGVVDQSSAEKAGLSWSNGGKTSADHNAYAAYAPNGQFYKDRSKLPEAYTAYGKGTKVDGGTQFVLGNTTGAYASKEDYTEAVVMVAIYPNADPPRVDVYWKKNANPAPYIGDQARPNVPKYSISIPLS